MRGLSGAVRNGLGWSGGSLLTVHESLDVLDPSAVIMVGIGFGCKPDKQQVGDVLISRQVMSYEPQRVTGKLFEETKITPRGDRISASPRLIDRFRAGQVGWTKAGVHFGLLLSGEKLIDSPVFKAHLLQLEPEAIGGDMEAAGVLAAAYKGKVDWIIAKGIADWAEAKDKKDQGKAAANAVDLVFHVIRQGGLVRPSS
jgi:nucleoside phosphorylase